jgi:hypothetical protein
VAKRQPSVSERIGINTTRSLCPHFDGWLKKLEVLGGAPASGS